MQKASITYYSVLAIVGVTALAAVACGSSNKSSPSGSSTAPKTTSSAVASPPSPSKVNGEDEVVGSIDSVSGTTITVSGPQGSASVAFSSSTKIMELTPVKATDITVGQCVTIRPASGAEGGTVTAEAVVVGASSGGQCQKTGGSDNAGLPRSPLGGFRGTVDSVSEKVIVLTTLGADGSTTKTTVQVNDTTLFADRHRVNGDAIVEGKCIIAGGTNDTGGTLQALTINLPLVVNGKCPQPTGS
jgi:Domain of unknown function (DUF5666)